MQKYDNLNCILLCHYEILKNTKKTDNKKINEFLIKAVKFNFKRVNFINFKSYFGKIKGIFKI